MDEYKEDKPSVSSASSISLSTADFDTLFEIAKEREDDSDFNPMLLSEPAHKWNRKQRSKSEKGPRKRYSFRDQHKQQSLDTDHGLQKSITRDLNKQITVDSLSSSYEATWNPRDSPRHGVLQAGSQPCSGNQPSPSSSISSTGKTSDRNRYRLSHKANSIDSAGSSECSSICAFRRVRSFRITSHGIEKEDLVVKSSKEAFKNNVLNRTNGKYDKHKTRALSTSDRHKLYKVMLLGSEGVGKRAMIQDFMMPDDYLEQLGFTAEDEDGEKSVSILLDGEESTLEFVDLSDEEISQSITTEQIDAYVVIYSVEDRRSFETAIDRLYEIRKEDGREVAVILVANKTDLVRTRVIFEEEGKTAANTYDCKYIEVSAAIDHKIDELLVGILKQIRLIKELRAKSHHLHAKDSGAEHKDSDKKFCCSLRAKHTVIEKLFGRTKRSAKSCENLYVL